MRIDERVERRPDGAYDIARDGVVTRVAEPGLAVIDSGYAPMLMQDLLLRAWIQHGRPKVMAKLPEGELRIESRGTQTYGTLALEHVAISGLVWGVEDAWLDDKGQLAVVITRDAEFDHHEAVRDGFEAVLPELAKASGVDGVARLAAAVQPIASGSVALVGATVIDGAGHAPISDAVVVIDGGTLVAIGPRASTAIPAGTKTVDVTGQFIVAGLWDMHAHVEQVEQNAVYLGAGVTTVLDMGNILPFVTGMRDAIDAGTGLGPRILANGLVDGDGPSAIGLSTIRTTADIPKVIDSCARPAASRSSCTRFSRPSWSGRSSRTHTRTGCARSATCPST